MSEVLTKIDIEVIYNYTNIDYSLATKINEVIDFINEHTNKKLPPYVNVLVEKDKEKYKINQVELTKKEFERLQEIFNNNYLNKITPDGDTLLFRKLNLKESITG